MATEYMGRENAQQISVISPRRDRGALRCDLVPAARAGVPRRTGPLPDAGAVLRAVSACRQSAILCHAKVLKNARRTAGKPLVY